MHRCFCDQPVDDANEVELTGGEAHHLVHVLRAQPGGEVILFDGRGDEFVTRIALVGRGRVCLHVLCRRTIDRELRIELTVAAAVPKRDRQQWLIEKLVELGVARFVPLITTHGVARPRGSSIDRWRRYVIEASKQCRRNRLMRIEPPEVFAAFVQQAVPDTPRYLAHPAAETAEPGQLSQPLPLVAPEEVLAESMRNQSVILAIGPEGGFTEDELRAAARFGWRGVQLGPRILRIETAAVALAALVALHEAVQP